MKVGPDVPEDNPKTIVATEDHFRVIDEHTMVFYAKGSRLPAAHTELKALTAKLADGVYVPKRAG